MEPPERLRQKWQYTKMPMSSTITTTMTTTIIITVGLASPPLEPLRVVTHWESGRGWLMGSSLPVSFVRLA